MNELKRVQEWLGHYSEWKYFLRNNKILIQSIEQEIALEAAPHTARYEVVAGGGGNSESQEEKALERKQELQARLKDLKARTFIVSTRIGMIENSLKALTSLEREIVQYRAFEGLSWVAIGMRMGYGEKTVRVRYKKAGQKLAVMLFGAGLDNYGGGPFLVPGNGGAMIA